MTATPGTNVLTLAPSLSAARDRQCTQLLNVGPPATLDVLQITYSDSAAERVEAWLSAHEELPARLGIVDVADRGGVAGDGSEELSASVAVTTANPNDITGLGMELNNYLNDLDTDCQLVVCFDSLTEPLQFTGLRGESPDLQGGDESDNSYAIHRSIARLDIPRSNPYSPVTLTT
ncbi:hypothetical protein IL252_13245 [Halomicrobium sp. IBSBa]|uniref:DUF7504 family protein n=1 Tax=Halomicrobium sp. IBSBa TaxID=2778916 RepID=UPI001ABFAF2B|nr:hypothetical protein [Halomicrobium sp. IBSBa]MBO4248783.1 hypothetical protein [Halomicrobium sp. IBSBa]